MNKIFIALTVLFATVFFAACEVNQDKSTNAKQAEQTEAMVAEANMRIGMPNIVNFTERRFAKQILERRDEVFTTYTYLVNLEGTVIFFCESIGYGLPYAVQFVNPKQIVERRYYNNGRLPSVIPQADPNGLYMPDSLSATWVMCANDKGEPTPVYVESEITVSPFKLPQAVGNP